MDIRLRGKIDGIETGRQITAEQPVPIIYLSGNIHMVDPTALGGRFLLLSKPLTDNKLMAAIIEMTTA